MSNIIGDDAKHESGVGTAYLAANADLGSLCLQRLELFGIHGCVTSCRQAGRREMEWRQRVSGCANQKNTVHWITDRMPRQHRIERHWSQAAVLWLSSASDAT